MSDFKLTGSSKVIIMIAVMASLLEIIDTSIVNVAIPTMMGNLGATLEDISWVVTGYIIANAIVLPIAGWLGVRIGRRTYYVGAILLFTATSVACGLAPNLTTLVIFRIVQGFAGGALLPTSQALIQEQFPRERAGMASAIYGMSVMIGPTIGPTLGGYLTDNFGWRSIFNINLPLGIVAAVLAFIFVKDYDAPAGKTQTAGQPQAASSAAKKRIPIDSRGLALLSVGIGCLQYVLERGQADDWFDNRAIVICSAIAAFCLIDFIRWELKTEHPIVNLRLFKSPAVRYGTILMMEVGFMLYSLVFIIPIFVGRVLHYTATQTGEMFIPGALLTAACMPFVGALLRKRDPRILIFFGICTIEVALLMMTRVNASTSGADFFNVLMVRGLGMAFLFVPINTVVLGQFSGPNLGQVAGLLNLFRQLGGSLGIAMLSTLLDRNNHQNYVDISNHVTLLNPATANALQQAQNGVAGKFGFDVGFGHGSIAALRMLSARLEGQMFILSFEQMMWVLLIAFGLALIPLIFLKAPKRGTGPILDSH